MYCCSEGKVINYLVMATVEKHDKNSGRRLVGSGLFPFILRTHLAYDVSVNLEASRHSASFPMTSYIPDEQRSGQFCAHISVCD